jgi:hypothetical protein
MRAYIATNLTSSPYYYAYEQMERWDNEFYRNQIKQYGLDEIIRSDWKNHWGVGSEVHRTLKGAERYADKNYLSYVVEIDFDVLRTAYTQTFGELD